MSSERCSETGLPLGDDRPAVETPHFPARYQAVIWRNRGLVTNARLATVLRTSEANIEEAARELGLGPAATPEMEQRWLRRGYVTLIRQNWHLLSYAQLLQLIGKTAEELAVTLREDDFLWHKLGDFKPRLEAVEWKPLSAEQRERTAAMRARLDERVKDGIAPSVDPPFAFLDRYGQAATQPVSKRGADPFKLKILYSYSAVYGDPLLDPEVDPYPDGLLADLAANGINGVWLQGILYTLVPWAGSYGDGGARERRIRNLNALIARAARHGIGIYLYLNEPRSMPPDFFAEHPEWRGEQRGQDAEHAVCTSAAGMLDALRDGVSDLFRKAPDLAGVFTITMSENLTHCRSKPTGPAFPLCARCADRTPAELAAGVNNAISDGVRAVNDRAAVIAWNWSWGPDWSSAVAQQLRPGVSVMCTSEAWLQTEAQGIRGRIADYTMSKVGPGFLADETWQQARARGLERVAKIQMNNTWECSAVPYLPVPFLVKDHLRNLEARGIEGLMVGWTLGGYPGGNLALTSMEPKELARIRFGPLAPRVIEAWKLFGDAFAFFPLHGVAMLYRGPQNVGPMNPLFAEPSGQSATMVGFPYDDITRWRGCLFPPEVFEEEFRRLSEGWAAGLDVLREAEPDVTDEIRAAWDDLVNVAEAAYTHFRSTYLQILFIRLRDETRTPETLRRMVDVLDEEIELALRLRTVVRRDSRIGFEASNHYYYTEWSLLEKVINCLQLKQELGGEQHSMSNKE